MNDDQQTRLEIMQALEKDFPDRVLEDLIDVALYVEHGGVHLGPEPVPSTQQLAEDGKRIRLGLPPLHIKDREPGTWASLADIPDDVWMVKDHDKDKLARIAWGGSMIWVYKSPDYENLTPLDEDGPFTEVLS